MAARWTFEGWVYHNRTDRRAGLVPTGRLRELMAWGEVRHTDAVWRQWGGLGRLWVPALAREALREEQPAGPFARGRRSRAAPLPRRDAS
jgi:hypothetical protein